MLSVTVSKHVSLTEIKVLNVSPTQLMARDVLLERTRGALTEDASKNRGLFVDG